MAVTQGRKDLLKIGQLAAESGVPVGTIKFYLREGLLPPPTVKTSRTMAYYDRSFLDRIRVIKRLQERYLPLRVIKSLLDEHKTITPAEAATLILLEPAVVNALQAGSQAEPATLREVRRRYRSATPERLALLGEMGLLHPRSQRGEPVFDGDDQALLEAMHRADEAGFSPELFPIEDLGHYVDLLGELADREVRLFTRHVTGRLDPAQARVLVAHALDASEPIILALRRKLLRMALEKALSAPQGRPRTPTRKRGVE